MNIKNRQCRSSHPLSRNLRHRGALPAAFLATMLALPASAVDIPNSPLTAGGRVAPNVMFILDDSGSMNFVAMPGEVADYEDYSNYGIDQRGLNDNPTDRSYLNNTVYYNPATDYSAWMRADGKTRWTGGLDVTGVYKSWSLASGDTRNIVNSDESVFYVPKPGVTSSTKSSDFDKYQVRAVKGGSPKVMKYSGKSWVEAVPTGRTQDAELLNIATWYSYHRSRMKTAKAGASEAFASPSLNKTIRLGFRGINNSTNGGIPYASGDGRFYDDTKNGVSNRTNWYSSLQGKTASGGTPLQGALRDAGDYFKKEEPYFSLKDSSDASKGYVGRFCRQNFTIMTTDGYWNGDTVSGNADNSDGSSFVNSDGKDVGYKAIPPYKDSQDKTLADVAMKYWKEDLRLDDANNVPATDSDPAFWQHMVTFGISIGLKGSLDQTSVAQLLKDKSPRKDGKNVNWPSVTNSTAINAGSKIDDLLHAALNGHGEFIVANDSKEFANGLAAALASITQRTSSYSNVATNSVSLDTGSKVFNASYVSGLWTGKLVARSVSDSGVGSVVWDTSEESTASIPAWSSRNVLTPSGSSLVSFPTAAQVTQLDRTKDKDGKALGALDYPISGADNAKYIKGDRTNEGTSGGKLRVRTGLLGDIIGSSPAYVKGGTAGDGSTDGTLYVGANDGMLHAFNAANGKELFAYVPSILNFDNLRDISRGNYTHNWFVDGPIVVDSKRLIASKTVLVGTLGRGGTGLFSLDVSTPASPAFKWELKDTADGNMGLVLGKPILTKIGSGKTPAVVFGNGPNSSKHRAVLIGRKLDDGAKLFEVDTGVGSATSPNGLSTVTGVYGTDGQTLAYAYAGDLQGNIWKFDLTKATPTATKLFTANTGQAITGAVTVAIHPLTNKRWILFGTGKFLEDADIESTAVQSMYGFIDDDAGTTLAPSDLVNNTPSGWGTEVVDGKTVRAFKAKAALANTAKGWRVDLPAGERVVQDAQIVSTFMVTTSMLPTGDACGADGSSYINAVDAFTGTSAGGSYFDLPGNDKMSSGIPIGSVDLGYGILTLPNLLRGLLVVGGSGGSNVIPLKTLTPRWDRVSWREVRSD